MLLQEHGLPCFHRLWSHDGYKIIKKKLCRSMVNAVSTIYGVTIDVKCTEIFYCRFMVNGTSPIY